MRTLVAIAALGLFLSSCRSDESTCRTLAERCPMAGNYESCRATLEPLSGSEARKRHDCVTKTTTCGAAAACVAGISNSWDFYGPSSKQAD